MDHRVLVFTVHKAASLGVYEVMRRVARIERWPLHSANLEHANLTEPVEPGDVNFFRQMEGKSGLAGPVRMPVTLDPSQIANDCIILHLRDPRDVLVSMYYSWTYSHPGVDEDLRQGWRKKGIDAFVLRQSADLKQKYELYVQHFLPLPQTTLLKYEMFVLDKPAWLRKFLAAAGANPNRLRYKMLAWRNPAAKVKSENVHAHIRKAAPGDYLEKLGVETRTALTREWKEILEVLNYT